jgi:hypothetical protein
MTRAAGKLLLVLHSYQKKTGKLGKMLAFELIMPIIVFNYSKNADIFDDLQLIKPI